MWEEGTCEGYEVYVEDRYELPPVLDHRGNPLPPTEPPHKFGFDLTRKS